MTKISLVAGSMILPALMMVGACSRASDTGTRQRTAENTKTNDFAFVRFIDATPQKSNLYFGDKELFSDAGTRGVTDYKQVPAERRDFVLREGSNGPEAKNSEGLNDGKHYTVVAYNDNDRKPALRVLSDDESAPADGKAKVRIIHAAANHEGIDLYAAGHKDKLASESRFTTGSTWQEVTPVNGTLEIRTTDHKGAPVRIPDVHLEAGRLYTFVVENGAHGLHVVPIVDNPHQS